MPKLMTNSFPVVFSIFLFLSFTFLIGPDSFSQANDISLAQSFPEERLKEILIPQNEWHPYPTVSEREEWDQIPDAIQHKIIEKAESFSELEVPPLPASVYLQFKRNGNRSNYQDLWFERRSRLHYLVTAESMSLS